MPPSGTSSASDTPSVIRFPDPPAWPHESVRASSRRVPMTVTVLFDPHTPQERSLNVIVSVSEASR